MTKTEKVFYVAVAIFSVGAGVGSYLLYDALHAFESIEGTQSAYHEISTVLTYAVPLAFLLLLVPASMIFMLTDRMRYFMYAYLFFAVFTVFDYVYVGELYFHFIKNSGLWKGGFSVMGLAGLFLCFCAFIIAAANYLILSTIKKMMTPKK